MAEQVYRIPGGLRIYAIGDIHGCLGKLQALQDEISLDLLRDAPQSAHIVYIGDYIDRGPESAGVLDYLIGRQERGDGIVKTFIEGNHERGMREFLEGADGALGRVWLEWGGIQTMESYGVSCPDGLVLPGEVERAREALRAAVPERHKQFLRELSSAVTIGDYFFTHAGIDPLKPLVAQTQKDLFLSREPFLSWHKDPRFTPLEKRVVHGHTVAAQPEVLPHRVGIDTGAYKGGKLTCAVIEGESLRFLQV